MIFKDEESIFKLKKMNADFSKKIIVCAGKPSGNNSSLRRALRPFGSHSETKAAKALCVGAGHGGQKTWRRENIFYSIPCSCSSLIK
jgi:hypothetical protein